MSERYSRLFALSENLYASGSPVVIAAGALLKDNQTGKVLAQLKLRSISSKAIKAATVSVTPFDTVGNPLGEPVSYQYLDLNVYRDDDFGSKSAIALPDVATRSFAATVTKIAFVDNTVWTATESSWEPLSVPSDLGSLLHGAEFAKQFRLEYGAGCKYFPMSEKDLWHCTCGALNHKGEIHCHSCKKSFAVISSYNVDELNAKKNKRLAEERAKAEYEAEQARIKAEKNAQLAKKLAKIFAIIAACVIAVSALVSKVITPSVKYSQADKLVAAGQYDEAIKAYKAIGDSEKTQERINAANYARAEAMLAEGKYTYALAYFENLGDYQDAKDKVNATIYAHGVDLLSKEKFNDAIAEFEKLGDYEDAAEMLKEAQYCIAEDLAFNRKYEAAIAQFDELGDYKDAAEKAKDTRYSYAMACLTKKKYGSALELFEQAGDYKDSREQAKK